MRSSSGLGGRGGPGGLDVLIAPASVNGLTCEDDGSRSCGGRSEGNVAAPDMSPPILSLPLCSDETQKRPG